MYHDRFQSLRQTWRSHEGDLVRAYRRLQDSGHLEVIISTATHAFFPLLDRNWPVMRAQVHVAADFYEKHFGRRPQGLWLGECGYIEGIDELLREASIRYFVVDSHALLHADEPPVYGVYAPVYCPSGVAAFARDTESSEQVWSAEHGYPGDPHYRDFYRDIGFDLPLDYIGAHVHPEGHRLYTGFKYHAITHEHLHDKWIYDPEIARGRAGLHAAHFRGEMEKQVARLAASMERPPLVVSPYDAELFGHWWFEGPIFLGDVFRQLHFDQSAIETMTPGLYLERHPTNQRLTPADSSWGLKGFNEQWLNETNAWISAPPPRRGRAHDGTRPEACERERERRARRPRAQSSGAGIDARAVERLALHHVDRDDDSLCHPPLQRAHHPIQPPMRGDRSRAAGRGRPSKSRVGR